jgi:hypothetical protein
MSSKVVLLQYVCDFAYGGGNHSSCKTAIVVGRSSDGFISIQGYTPVHHSEKHKAWSDFQVSLVCSVLQAAFVWKILEQNSALMHTTSLLLHKLFSSHYHILFISHSMQQKSYLEYPGTPPSA